MIIGKRARYFPSEVEAIACVGGYAVVNDVLDPIDVIDTGTPAGVALGQPNPKPYLRTGDAMELEIDGLGRARQRLVAA